MDITGASDPYVKIKLLDSKVGLKPQTIRKVRIKIFDTKVGDKTFLFKGIELNYSI